MWSILSCIYCLSFSKHTHRFQLLSCSLMALVLVVIAEGESGGCKDSQGPIRLQNVSPDSTSCSSRGTPVFTETSCWGNCHTVLLFIKQIKLVSIGLCSRKELCLTWLDSDAISPLGVNSYLWSVFSGGSLPADRHTAKVTSVNTHSPDDCHHIDLFPEAALKHDLFQCFWMWLPGLVCVPAFSLSQHSSLSIIRAAGETQKRQILHDPVYT